MTFGNWIVCCHISKACCTSHQCVLVFCAFMNLKYIFTLSKQQRTCLLEQTAHSHKHQPSHSNPAGLIAAQALDSFSRIMNHSLGGGTFENFLQQPGWAHAGHCSLHSAASISFAGWCVCSGIIQRAAVIYRLLSRIDEGVQFIWKV